MIANIADNLVCTVHSYKARYAVELSLGAGVMLSARVPIILTSRADDTVSRMASCALALLWAQRTDELRT